MVLVGIVAVVLVAIDAVTLLGRPVPNDFLSFWYAGQAAAKSINIYDTLALRKLARADGSTGGILPYLYPPFLANILGLFAKTQLDSFYRVWVWILVGSTSLTGVLACTIHRPGRRRRANVVPMMVTAICVLVLPFTNNIAQGQVNLIVLACIILALVSYWLGYPLLAGALLAPAVLLKWTPVVLVGFFLARRSYRAIVGFAAAALLLVIVSLAIGGVKPWLDFYAALPDFAHGKDIARLLPCAVIYNFAPAGYFLRIFANERELVRWISIALAVGVFVVSFATAFLARNRREEHLALALFFPMMIVLSPLTWLHHVVFLIPTAVILLTWAFAERRSSVLFGSIVVVLAICSIDWPVHYGKLGQLFAKPSLQGINLFSILLLFCIGVLAYWLARRTVTRLQDPDSSEPTKPVSQPQSASDSSM